MRPIISALLVFAVAAAAPAAEFAPRVLSPHRADAYSMKTFGQYALWRDLEGDAKAWEIFKYLADKRSGIFPMGAGAWEGEDVMYDYGYIRDPVKMINVYTAGYCDMLGPTMEGVMRGVGFKQARTVNMPSISHVVCEVFYDGKWHYLDLDLRAAFRRPDGTLASIADSRTDPTLWKGPTGPLFFPLDNLKNTQKGYIRTTLAKRHNVFMGGHTMDYLLRRGETFTRWWTPQGGGRWNHHASYHQGAKKRILERKPLGPKCKHASFSVHGMGNGRFVYAPGLSTQADVDDGVYDAKNIAVGADGLGLKGAGAGHVIFEVRSPYVIVPVVNAYETTDDDAEASVVEMDADGAELSVSTDCGKTWTKVAAAGGKVDLTPQVARKYGYLLKVDLAGKALLRSLRITTWVQLHPAALPCLKKGTNKMRYVTGDDHGLSGRVMEVRPNGAVREELLKWCSEPPKDYDPARKTNRIRGRFVVKLDAPPKTTIAWFSGGGNFRAHQAAAAPKTANTMAFAAGESKNFKQFYKAAVPAGQGHWHYNADVAVKLDEPAKTVYLEYVGDPGVNNIRVFAHCVDDAPRKPTPVTIVHKWLEAGAEKTRTVTLDKDAGDYVIECPTDPKDVSIEMSVPSAAGK